MLHKRHNWRKHPLVPHNRRKRPLVPCAYIIFFNTKNVSRQETKKASPERDALKIMDKVVLKN